MTGEIVLPATVTTILLETSGDLRIEADDAELAIVLPRGTGIVVRPAPDGGLEYEIVPGAG